MRVALLAVAVACAMGCNQILGIGDFHVGDGGGDDASSCLGSTTLYKFCPAAVPTGTVLINQDVDTDTDDRCVNEGQPNGPDLCVMAGDTVTVQQMSIVTGKRPLVLVAANTIQVDGVVDLSSQHPMPGPGRIGAGANAAGICASLPGTSGTNGAGGGAGGSFGAAGGDGSTDGGGSTDNGVASAPITLTAIQAGCSGGAGGVDNNTGGGLAGAGGGAVYLIAGTSIDVTTQGRVYASGAGGSGATANHSGGGGAGAGGLIGFDAPMITVEGVVSANGGGGGGGTNGGPAAPSEDGSTMNFTHQANGGNAAGGGGDGGDGGATTNAAEAGKDATSTDGGGGGGGSVGIVWTKGSVTGMISPNVTAQ